MHLVLDHHILYSIVIFGTILDILGSLYLAYELLGGQKGPLRNLTEMISVGVLFIGTGLLGTAFVLFAGLQLNLSIVNRLSLHGTVGAAIGFGGGGGLGLALGFVANLIQTQRSNRTNHTERLPFLHRLMAGLGVGILAGLILSSALLTGPELVHGLITGLSTGLGFGVGAGVMAGFILAKLVVLPFKHGKDSPRPHFDKAGPILGIILCTPAGIMAAFAYWVSYGPMTADGLKLALLIAILSSLIGGLGGGFGIGVAQWIDWRVSALKETHLGAFGAILIILGFLLQSIQYWVQVFDVPIR